MDSVFITGDVKTPDGIGLSGVFKSGQSYLLWGVPKTST
jgi:hypothetical protein